MIGIGTVTTIITFLLSTWPNNPSNNEDTIDEIAAECVWRGKEYGLDPVLLAVIGFHESSLRKEAEGKAGEVGIMQVHGKARKACENASISPFGVGCGAFLLNKYRNECGSIRRGLNRYMSGSCNGTPRSIRGTNMRLYRAAKLRKKYADESSPWEDKK